MMPVKAKDKEITCKISFTCSNLKAPFIYKINYVNYLFSFLNKLLCMNKFIENNLQFEIYLKKVFLIAKKNLTILRIIVFIYLSIFK